MSKGVKSCTPETAGPDTEQDVLLSLGHKRYKASIAYARALFQFARDTGLLEQVCTGFGDFIRVWREVPTLQQFLECHAINRTMRKARLRHFFGTFVHASVLYFIEKVMDNNHVDLLPAIHAALSTMADDVHERRRVRVISPFPLNDTQKKRLQQGLEQSLKREVILRNEVDPAILGGFVCYADSIKIDMSLKRELEKLKSHILLKPCEGDGKR